MKLDKVASSQNDEFYTPSYAISPILFQSTLSSRRATPESIEYRPFEGDGLEELKDADD